MPIAALINKRILLRVLRVMNISERLLRTIYMMFNRPMMIEEGRLNIGAPIKKPQFPFEFWGLVSRL